MNPPRLAHETLPPALPINDFTRFAPPVGLGGLSPENQKIGQRRRWRHRAKIRATFRLGTAAREFKIRYGYFPGDLPKAGDLIKNDGGISIGCSYPYIKDETVANGLVDTERESVCALEHLVKARMINKAEKEVGGTAYVIRSPIGPGVVSLWYEKTLNQNAVRVRSVPCAVALEIDRKLDNAADTPFKLGYVLGQNKDGNLIDTCAVGGLDDPVAALLVQY